MRKTPLTRLLGRVKAAKAAAMRKTPLTRLLGRARSAEPVLNSLPASVIIISSHKN
jgi:hypothetical protein